MNNTPDQDECSNMYQEFLKNWYSPRPEDGFRACYTIMKKSLDEAQDRIEKLEEALILARKYLPRPGFYVFPEPGSPFNTSYPSDFEKIELALQQSPKTKE